VRDGSTPILLRVLLFMRYRVYPGSLPTAADAKRGGTIPRRTWSVCSGWLKVSAKLLQARRVCRAILDFLWASFHNL